MLELTRNSRIKNQFSSIFEIMTLKMKLAMDLRELCPLKQTWCHFFTTYVDINVSKNWVPLFIQTHENRDCLLGVWSNLLKYQKLDRSLVKISNFMSLGEKWNSIF